MTQAPPPPPLHDRRTGRAILWLAAGFALVRIAVLFLSPLELYPDEAQYWLWSRSLHWGYVSKPPMIAWLIWATTRLGDQEAWTRLCAPLAHALAMAAVGRTGLRLYGARAGLLAAVLYGLMPAVQVSALFVATDAPLLAFLAVALWAYAALMQSPPGRGGPYAAGFGAALGLAFLAKFAAVYFVLGALIHAACSGHARRAWRGGAWLWALLALALAFGPNLAWQASHGFATLTHTSQVNAHWSAASFMHPGKLLEFLVGQLGVFGPIPLVALVVGLAALGRRRAFEPADRLLVCFIAPALVLVSIQAFVSRAHAHWASASYVPASVLVAGWLVRWRARGWTWTAVALQGLVALTLAAVVAWPVLADVSGNGRRLQRIRGWAASARIVTSAAAARPDLTAVAVEDRYLFNELAYYGRTYFAAPGAAPLRMRPAPGPALNEAELSSPLRREEGGRVLVAETEGKPETPALPREFSSLTPLGRWTVPLDSRHARTMALFLGEGYRGPVSGLPTEP